MPWEDNLDDFERQLAASKSKEKDSHKLKERHNGDTKARRHHHDDSTQRSSGHDHQRGHRSDRDQEDMHRHKRRRRSRDRDDIGEDSRRHRRRHQHHDHDRQGDVVDSMSDNHGRSGGDVQPENGVSETDNEQQQETGTTTAEDSRPELALKRDAWMEAPSALDVDYIQKPLHNDTQEPIRQGSPRARFDLKIHEAELNKHHLQELAAGKAEPIESEPEQPTHLEVNYEFGDNGSRWRMMKLQNVYREAEESKAELEEVALRQYGSLRVFDEAREEEIEMDRRKSYGKGYVGKIKPSGDLFQERKMESGVHREGTSLSVTPERPTEGLQFAGVPPLNTLESMGPPAKVTFDPTALNKLRAQLMRAKLKGLPEAAKLEQEYEMAQKASDTQGAGRLVVLGAMENRMLAGGGRAEVKEASNRRARERGQVEENENMSIDDMVREERRTKGIFGNEDQRFASRIAKDGKFTNDLDYMDENASKLAKRVHQSDSALRSAAISQHQQSASVLASCPLCHQEDRQSDPLPIAPVVSLAHRCYLTLPTSPEIKPDSSSIGGAIIVPLIHHDNLLHCDDDEWEEMRNFMKSLIRMYHARDLGVLFYENAAHPRKHRHAALVAVPIPLRYTVNVQASAAGQTRRPAAVFEDAPAFFREAILASDDEWAQHRKILDSRGKGKNGFRRTIAKEVPYFHVWTELDGGLGHVIEDERRWPRGDLFAREVLGGMLRVEVEVWRRQGRWDKSRETASRVQRFRKSWEHFDWTKMLVEQQPEGGP